MSAEEPDPITFVVGQRDAGERLDRAIAARPEIEASRSEVQRWLKDGRVVADGELADRKTRTSPLMEITVRPAPPPTTTVGAEDLPLSVLFEDEHLIVVDKAAGMVVHPAPGHPTGTLVNALLHLTQLAPADEPPDVEHGVGAASDVESAAPARSLRPGIVHRLDKDTSGVMVVAKSRMAHEGLVRLFQAHDIERRYVTIAVGSLGEPGRTIDFDTFHGRHPHDRKRFSSKVMRGKRAVTHVKVVEKLHAAALCDVTLETGRTHQIRVHLSDHGTPVLADSAYGKSPRDPRLSRAAEQIGRQALHAQVLGFEHPVTGEQMRFEAPLPAPFADALATLREDPKGRG